MHEPPARAKAVRHKACISCAKLRAKCDNARPCAQCVLRNLGDACEDPARKSSCTMCRRLRAKCDKERPCGRCVESRQASACSSVTDMMASRHRGRSRANLLLAASGDGPGGAGVVLAAPSHDGPGATRAMAVDLGSCAGFLDGWRTESSARDETDAAPPSAGVTGALLMKSLMQYEDVPPLESVLQSTALIGADLPFAGIGGSAASSEAEDSAASTCSIDGWDAWDALEFSLDPTLDLMSFGAAC